MSLVEGFAGWQLRCLISYTPMPCIPRWVWHSRLRTEETRALLNKEAHATGLCGARLPNNLCRRSDVKGYEIMLPRRTLFCNGLSVADFQKCIGKTHPLAPVYPMRLALVTFWFCVWRSLPGTLLVSLASPRCLHGLLALPCTFITHSHC